MSRYSRSVFDAVRRIPAGRVAAYGDIAAAAGRPGTARQVGRALSTLGGDHDVPWWRVVNVRGGISVPRSGGAASVQRALLAEEGVTFRPDGTIDMAAFAWREETADVD